jgi:anti-sigma B factor antagonist
MVRKNFHAAARSRESSVRNLRRAFTVTTRERGRTEVPRRPAPIAIEMDRPDHIVLVIPKGDLTLSCAEDVARTIARVITPRRARLVIDLTNVAYLDSAGLGALVSTLKLARARGGDVKFCGLQELVRSVFDMTRLTSVVEIYPSREDALASSWGAGQQLLAS